MNIPLSVLVQAHEALKAACDYDTTNPLPHDLWAKVFAAPFCLGSHVRPLTETVKVEVAA